MNGAAEHRRQPVWVWTNLIGQHNLDGHADRSETLSTPATYRRRPRPRILICDESQHQSDMQCKRVRLDAHEDGVLD